MEKVSEQMKKSLNLSEIDLKPVAGGFEGTGKNADGESYTITVKLDPSNSRFAYHAVDESEDFDDGYYPEN